MAATLFLHLILAGGLSGNYALANSQSLSKSTKVTSYVPDTQSPLPPLLISPSNNSIININQPQFLWSGSNDNVAISFYRIWLDGEILLAGIEPSAGINGVFTFFSSIRLDDGVHTWQVEAVDTSGNSRFSATWTFTIDTLAPIFSIDQIDELAVTINAPADLGQDQPYIVSTSTPSLSGKGEAGNLVKLSIITADGQNIGNLEFTVDGNGLWSIKLPILAENTIYYLTLIIQDQAGNISLINKLPLMFIRKTTLLVPPIIEALADQPKYLIGLLTPFTAPPKSQSQGLIGSIAVATWLIASVFFGIVYLSLKLGKIPGFHDLRGWLWILGWWPNKNKVGLVYDVLFDHHVALATISIFHLVENSRAYQIDRVLTNRYGEYMLPDLDQGVYRLGCYHKNCVFPAWRKRPKELTWRNYYLGEEFLITHESTQLPVVGIPVIVDHGHSKQGHNRLLWMELASWQGQAAWLIHLPTCIVLTLMFPNIANLISFAIYMLVLIYKYKK